MASSIFTDKVNTPDITDLQAALGDSYPLWQTIVEYIHQKYNDTEEEWIYPGVKYGWSLRIKDKCRSILYLLPRDNYFKAAFIFGQRATDRIMSSCVRSMIKTELESAREYAQGRGIKIDVRIPSVIKSINILIDIKLET